MSELLLTYREVAEKYGFRLGTLYALVHQGRMPFTRLGPRFIRFRAADVESWLTKLAVQPRATFAGDVGRSAGPVIELGLRGPAIDAIAESESETRRQTRHCRHCGELIVGRGNRAVVCGACRTSVPKEVRSGSNPKIGERT
jgi:excisionase family DNA binding protein